MFFRYQAIERVIAHFGDDTYKQPEEFFATFEQFMSKVDECRAENEQQAKKEEEERKKKLDAAAALMMQKEKNVTLTINIFNGNNSKH